MVLSAMDTTAPTVTCFARAGALGPRVDETIETLRDYDQRGTIDALTVDVWPDEVVLAAASRETTPVVQYHRFRRWAERAGVSLSPAFTIRRQASLVDEQPASALVLPVVCLAVRVDGELTTVAPHRFEGTAYTVEDVLEDLGSPTRTESQSPIASTAGVSTPSE
jgi:hypothetical protein